MNGYFMHNQQKPSKLFAFEWKSNAKNDRIMDKSEHHPDGRCEHCGGIILKAEQETDSKSSGSGKTELSTKINGVVNGFHKRLGTPGKHIRFAASVLSSDKESADKSFDTQEFIAKTFEVYEKSHKTEKNKIANQSAKFSDRGLISAPQRAKQQQTAEKPFDAKEFIEKTLAAYEQSRMISQTMELAGVPSWAKSTNSTTKKTAEPPKSSMKAATALFPSSGRTRKKWDSETSGKPNFRPAAAAERDLETSKTLTWTYKASLYASNHLCRLVKPRSTVGETPREKAKRLVALAKSGRKSYKNINNVAHLSPTGKGSLERPKTLSKSAVGNSNKIQQVANRNATSLLKTVKFKSPSTESLNASYKMYAELCEQISQMRARLRFSINNLCSSRPELYWPAELGTSTTSLSRDPKSRSMDSLLWQQRVTGERGKCRYITDWLKSVRSDSGSGRSVAVSVQDFRNFKQNSVLHQIMQKPPKVENSASAAAKKTKSVQPCRQAANTLLFGMGSLPSLAFGQVAAYSS